MSSIKYKKIHTFFKKLYKMRVWKGKKKGNQEGKL
jgi:hypothetical protein